MMISQSEANEKYIKIEEKYIYNLTTTKPNAHYSMSDDMLIWFSTVSVFCGLLAGVVSHLIRIFPRDATTLYAGVDRFVTLLIACHVIDVHTRRVQIEITVCQIRHFKHSPFHQRETFTNYFFPHFHISKETFTI